MCMCFEGHHQSVFIKKTKKDVKMKLDLPNKNEQVRLELTVKSKRVGTLILA
jgi:hypothetical protein